MHSVTKGGGGGKAIPPHSTVHTTLNGIRRQIKFRRCFAHVIVMLHTYTDIYSPVRNAADLDVDRWLNSYTPRDLFYWHTHIYIGELTHRSQWTPFWVILIVDDSPLIEIVIARVPIDTVSLMHLMSNNGEYRYLIRVFLEFHLWKLDMGILMGPRGTILLMNNI